MLNYVVNVKDEYNQPAQIELAQNKAVILNPCFDSNILCFVLIDSQK